MNEQACGQLVFCQEDSPVNRSPLPGSGEARRMTATSGRKCCGLSKSCGPLGLLEKMLLDSSAWRSTMRYLTWRAQVTPRGRLYFRLAPSKPRTSECDASLLPTPTASLAEHGGPQSRDSSGRPGLQMAAMMWPTPTVSNGGRTLHHVDDWRGNTAYHNGKKVQVDLAHAVKMWPTPQARDYFPAHSQEYIAAKKAQGHGMSNLNDTVMWATPHASCNTGPSNTQEGGPNLQTQVGGQLNPTWVEWLMGFPIGWTDLDASATR